MSLFVINACMSMYTVGCREMLWLLASLDAYENEWLLIKINVGEVHLLLFIFTVRLWDAERCLIWLDDYFIQQTDLEGFIGEKWKEINVLSGVKQKWGLVLVD